VAPVTQSAAISWGNYNERCTMIYMSQHPLSSLQPKVHSGFFTLPYPSPDALSRIICFPKRKVWHYTCCNLFSCRVCLTGAFLPSGTFRTQQVHGLSCDRSRIQCIRVCPCCQVQRAALRLGAHGPGGAAGGAALHPDPDQCGAVR